MVAVRSSTRAAIAVLMGAGLAVWYACSDRASDSPTGPLASPTPSAQQAARDLRGAIAVQRRYTEALLRIPGVLGTAVGLLPDGRPGVQLLLERPGIVGLPQTLDGTPVTQRVTGLIMAFSDPTTRQRPAPMGYSVGHPDITAGTIGARVVDALGRVYILSNNHVLANSNGATIGDPEYQPGPFDGGTAADSIATLTDFQTITFSGTASNVMDAAIALSTISLLDNATPSDDGYGMPNATIYGDADGDGLFDDPPALLGLNVQKYGRTTKLTHGTITGVSATVTVCYAASGITCTKSARFVDQLLISPGGFSGGGDSGSLIVTDDANLNPVALLFAGSSSVTIANRIDLVLTRFGVAIDGFAPPPPGPLTDLAVTSLSAPATMVQGDAAGVTVTVRNVGNQDVTTAFDITLEDSTTGAPIGAQTVTGLAAGATTTATFSWTPTTTGDHVLVGAHTLSDDRATNDRRSTIVTVNAPVTDLAVTSVSAPGAVSVGHVANIGLTVRNVGNQNVGATFTVTLRDSTDHVTVGAQTVPGLAAGASTTLTFAWNTTGATLGGHLLVASHDMPDDNAANDRLAATVTVNPPLTDIGITGITAPASVKQGDTAHVGVTVQNVGEVDVSTSFTVVLTDGSDGSTIGTQTIAGLAVGAGTTLDFPWNTAGATIAGHILIAQQTLPDDNPSNNSLAIGIVVNPPAPVGADVAVTAINAPAAVSQGVTATVGVTVQNVGAQDIATAFDVVLTDATAGTTIGTQTVAGLTVGALTTLNFSWNTTGAALGGHTIVANATLTDDNTANNQASATVTVNPPFTDIALTTLTGPSSVIQGDTAHISATVQNVGGQTVTTTFGIVLTDATAGLTIDTQTVAGLAAGATASRTFDWNTAGVATNGHILIATQLLPDNNTSNDAKAIAVTVNPPPPPTVTDVAVTGVSAPASASQGQTISVTVTLQNVGNQNVAAFSVTLQDATDGVTIGTEGIAGMAAGAGTTRTFSWNTTTASVGAHTLVASHSLSDDNAANNQATTGVTVDPPSIDVAVMGLSAPASVTQGNTASVGVTVQNVGGQAAGAFDVVLTDATAGTTIGTQTVSSLAAGASTTRTFSWNTTGAAPGGHTLVATHTLADNNAANNQASAVVTVNLPPADLAVTSVTGPASVTVGDTAHLGVTVQNVGGQNVTAGFDVVLTDATTGVTIGTQTVAGLTVGATASLSFDWNTAGVATTGHTLIARQLLADANASNDSRALGVIVNPPGVHVGNLDATTVRGGNSWSATVEITVHDAKHNPLSGVTVSGTWNGSDAAGCATGSAGTCTVELSTIPNANKLVSFAVSGLSLSGFVYLPAANHDPDGSSNGSSIIVKRQ